MKSIRILGCRVDAIGRDAAVERVAFAKESGTVILSLGAAAEGTPFTVSGWDTGYLEGA